ncbi:MAG: bifunctional 5,10-methylenetetrahydrofolate dehydrogenase/5,10-methenyltetrahydrofolate cyclohydrolase [bacterium]|nr:bifunctional 5,10-methylenetetrahydrofolate dehydrogenase/5,10-methenyltetrahydrofolate cyclohydrolase [bacterium]
MTEIVDGRAIAENIRAEISERVLKLSGGPPGIAVVLVGDDPASQIYVRNKGRMARKLGMNSFEIKLPEETSEAELLEQVQRLNEDPKVHGILVQLPVPEQISEARVAAAILPEKDIDGLHPENAGNLLANRPGFAPGTPEGCIRILEHHEIAIEGAHAVVIGRSEIVGKPVALMLLHRNATVTVCHSRTKNLPEVVRQADIVIAAVGVPEMIKGDWIKPGAAVIDVGTTKVEGKLKGDVDFDDVNGRAGLLTPVPGGVGPLTIAMVLLNTLRAFERLNPQVAT